MFTRIFVVLLSSWFLFVFFRLHFLPIGHGFDDYFLLPGGAISLAASAHSWCMFLLPTQLMQVARKIAGPGDDYLVAQFLSFALTTIMAFGSLSLRYRKYSVLFISLAAPMILLPTQDTNAYGKLVSISYNCSYNRLMDLVSYYTFLTAVQSRSQRWYFFDALWFAFALGAATLTKPTYLPELGLLLLLSQRQHLSFKFWILCLSFFLLFVIPELVLQPGYANSILAAAKSRHQSLHQAIFISMQHGAIVILLISYLFRRIRLRTPEIDSMLGILIIFALCEPFIVAGNTGDIANLRFVGALISLLFLFRISPWYQKLQQSSFGILTGEPWLYSIVGCTMLYPLRFLYYTTFKILVLIISINGFSSDPSNFITFSHLPGFVMAKSLIDKDFLGLENDLQARRIFMTKTSGKEEITLNYMMFSDLNTLIDRHPNLLKQPVLVPEFASSILVYAYPETRPLAMLSSYSSEVPVDMSQSSIQKSLQEVHSILLNLCGPTPILMWSRDWLRLDQSGCWELLGKHPA